MGWYYYYSMQQNIILRVPGLFDNDLENNNAWKLEEL